MRRARATAALVAALALAGCGGPEPEPAAGPVASASTAAPERTPAPVPAPPTASPTAVPPAVPEPLVLAESVPVRLTIEAIGVDSDLMELGLLPDGTMEVPPSAFPAGWFTGAPTPGELGPAVIAGHVDWTTGPGVFIDLARLAPGDHVQVARADGTVADFAVTAVEEYPKDEFPTESVYGDLDHAGLRLITCGGDWDDDAGHYAANTVVYAELVGSSPAT